MFYSPKFKPRKINTTRQGKTTYSGLALSAMRVFQFAVMPPYTPPPYILTKSGIVQPLLQKWGPHLNRAVKCRKRKRDKCAHFKWVSLLTTIRHLSTSLL